MEKLKRTKSAIKCSITKLEGFIGDNPDAKTTNISQLEVKLNKVKNVQQKLEELRDNYYDIQDLPNLQEIEQDIEEISDRLENVEVSLKLLLASFKAEVINISHTNESSKEVKTKVRLPEIPLPSFSGSYAEFNNFKIQFINLIDKNEQLDDSQKLYYLKAALKAEARLLEAADDNYNSLFQALIRRYENKRLVIDAHISEILNFEKIHHESVKELRNFIDCINKNVRALKVLEYSQNDLSEAILINVILNKLDKESQKQFELSLETTSVPKFEYLMSFLEKRSSVLENLTRNNPSQIKSFKITNTKGSINKSKTLIVNENKTNLKPCICCFQQHPLFRCKAFINLSVTNRKEFVNKNKLCINCLRKHKGVCNSKFQCRNCNLFHNTLLCENKIDEKNQLENETKAVSVSAEINHIVPQAEAKTFLANDNKNKFVLLNTALIYIRNQEGKKVRLRCLLDSASTINIITEKAAKLINNKLIPIKSSVTGINCFSEPIKNVLNAQLSNEDGSFSRNVEFAVLQKITSDVPVTKLDISNLIIPPGIKLADNNFHIPSPIDALIGSELFFDILKGDKINLGEGNCTLVATRFGYLVAGTLPQADNSSFCCLLNTVSLDNTLKKFFELEALPGDNKDLLKSEEELFCEEHFKRTYKRDKSGRFIVQLPIKENAEVLLGDSKENAIKRLNHIWAKLDKNNTMANLYREFLEEYENLGHMKEINFENSSNTSYFIPHHAVHRPESLSTPLRVVFNASASTSTGYSLNSLLLNGGNIQQDLFSIVTRFRTHKYAFCADIKKMYRQILINPSQRHFQRIVWKAAKNAPIKVYELCTVTYGTVSAPFLAMRTLRALAEEEEADFPEAAAVLCNDMYMDDCLSGADTLYKAQRLQSQLLEILQRGGMELHKWVSNHPEMLQDRNKEEYSFDENSTDLPVRALGMLWKPQSDNFFFKININPKDNYTKREVLSEIAKIYDPLGLIGPILTKAKIFMQDLWQLKLDWNDSLPPVSLQEWKQFLVKLTMVNNIIVPRYVLGNNIEKIELHGFSDASGKAYGAAIYLRCLSTDGQFNSQLLCSKSRVAPVKTVTIPRLELCAALLLSRLVKKLLPTLQVCFDKVWLWTDSSIVLSWISTPPHQLKTFVANRVAEIQKLSENYYWTHISSVNNPADIISRGAYASEIHQNNLWWYGPKFLQQEITTVRDLPAPIDNEYDLERKPNFTLITVQSDFFYHLFNLTNDFYKLIRICSFIFRFINMTRNKAKPPKFLTSKELKVSTEFLIKKVQEGKFACELDFLKKGKNVLPTSKLRSLDPFLDKNGLLRVGGRLTNSNLPFDAKHQLILPNDHKLTKMIFDHFHKKYLHIGAQGLVHEVRMHYWPIKAKSIARQTVHNCVTCFKHKPRTLDQVMGNLPSERVTPNSAFLNSGVDMCGPFLVKYKNQRKGVYSKVYVAIFICMCTKAIHLEIVSDLSAAAFIAALKRFCARRGKIITLTSDNATNFKGASGELNSFKKILNHPDEELANFLSSEFINWKFIPPRSPNFGGLWEAGVKSFKHHLHRAVGNNKLTLEDFETLIIQIEGILNSRPLFPLSDDINEFEVLTPGHFLIGRPISCIPEPNIIDISDNRLSHWQRITKYVQCIWKRWSVDYLNHLQQRGKWQFKKDNIKVGALVLVKEENLPPSKWALARIMETISGKDNKIRTCKLKTESGTFIRPISKLYLLPIKDNF